MTQTVSFDGAAISLPVFLDHSSEEALFLRNKLSHMIVEVEEISGRIERLKKPYCTSPEIQEDIYGGVEQPQGGEPPVIFPGR